MPYLGIEWADRLILFNIPREDVSLRTSPSSGQATIDSPLRRPRLFACHSRAAWPQTQISVSSETLKPVASVRMTEEVQHDRSSRESQRSHFRIMPQLQRLAAFRLKQTDMRISIAQNCSDHRRAIDLLLVWNPQRRPSEQKAPKWGLVYGSLAGLPMPISRYFGVTE